ncbi:sec-independent protein translocase protein TatB [Neorhizobium galegae]|uniref:Sec-independent protein translocase protein TatB n=1 Tax=Neorhizobium galegae TaxID=399 RepID=UPI001AE23D78|nr:Sec-independent protein translocase protein TatB [Neorhizobium galegae]MBP2549086.1 sec-independent protein translocase protein TatB [Neorhizobium galegae]
MLDIGWTELLVIAVVLIVVVGPKDLPPMLRAFGKMTSNLRKMAGDFRTQFDQALREADMDDVRQTISDAQRFNPANALREAMNPLREMGNEIRNDLQKATEVPKSVESEGPEVTSVEDLMPAPSLPLPETPPIVAATPAQPVAGAATGTPSPASPATTPVPAASAPATSAPASVSPAVVEPTTVARKPRAARKPAVKPADVAGVSPALETAVPAVAKPRRAAKSAVVPASTESGAAGEPAVVKPAARTRKKSTTPKDEA